MLQIVASLTDDTRSVNYDRNTFIIQATGKLDPDLKRVELLFHLKGGSACFGAKMALSLNGVDPGCMNPITGSTFREKCSNILHDI